MAEAHLRLGALSVKRSVERLGHHGRLYNTLGATEVELECEVVALEATILSISACRNLACEKFLEDVGKCVVG